MIVGILIALMVLISTGLIGFGIYMYVNRDRNSGDLTVEHGAIELDGTGEAHVDISSESGEIDKKIDPNKLSLINQTSFDKCTLGDTYDLIDENSMYATNGCAGIFSYKGKIGYCGSVDAKKTECPIGNYKINQSLKLAGLVDSDLELIQDISGKCDGNWGKVDDFSMVAKNGCQGKFKYGNMFGYCVSDGKDKICPFGKTIDDPDYSDKNPVAMQHIGLRKQELKFKGSDEKRSSCIPFENNLDIYFNVNPDGKSIVTRRGCQGKFAWGPYTGNCNSYEGVEATCPVGSTIEDSSGNEVGLTLSKYW